MSADILDRPATVVYLVSEYEVDRCYGGSEEGGWWYDAYSYVATREVLTDEADAQQLARALNAAQRELDRDTGKRDRYSVIGEPDTTFEVESLPGEHATTTRPHYE